MSATFIPSESDGARGAEVGIARSAESLLRYFVESALIHPDDWRALPRESMDRLNAAGSIDAVLEALVETRVLNPYHVERVRAGAAHGLVLGNYRVLGPLGAGGHGVAFQAEHILMRHKVAIKVLPIDGKQDAELMARFLRELRSVAMLNHPNIVSAIDAGVCRSDDAREPDFHYVVMEHLSGQDLEQLVKARSLSVREACVTAYQIASALDAAHQQGLIHRNIKPSNVFITQDDRARLLDFGLVSCPRRFATATAHALVGTLDYLAPEQARDPTISDIRTDIYSLGATLYYALIGHSPSPLANLVGGSIPARKGACAGSQRPDVPAALDAVLAGMTALRPEDRFAKPRAVMRALLPFVEDWSIKDVINVTQPAATPLRDPISEVAVAATPAEVLIIDPHVTRRRQLKRVLETDGIACLEMDDADHLLPALHHRPFAAILLAVDHPKESGREILRSLRENPPCPNLKILMIADEDGGGELAALMALGADDVLSLSLSSVQLAARVRAAIRHKEALDQLSRLNQQLLDLNVDLERGVAARTGDVSQARNALVMALARLVEYRSTETFAHLTRVQRYCVILAQAVAEHPNLAGQVDRAFLDNLECSAPLHDLGNVGLPDAILLKAGPLTDDERAIMQTHTVIGADTLRKVAHRFGAADNFLRMAIDVTRSHHEHYDGSGYPDGLTGDRIPLAARFVALADTYDSLRCRRAQRPRLAHAAAAEIVLDALPGKFDPLVLGAFRSCAAQFDRVYCSVNDSISMD